MCGTLSRSVRSFLHVVLVKEREREKWSGSQPVGTISKREDSGDGPGIKIHHEGSHDLLGHMPRGPDRFDPPSRPSASSRLLDCSTAITAATLVAHTRAILPIVPFPLCRLAPLDAKHHTIPYNTMPYPGPFPPGRIHTLHYRTLQ